MTKRQETERLHQMALKKSELITKTQLELIEILQQLDRSRGYRLLGFSSLYDYCLRGLKLSDNVTVNLIGVARITVKVPELKTAISQGKITVTKARKIAPVITSENKDDWLQKAIELPQKDLEKAVAKENPKSEEQTRVKYVSDKRMNLSTGISEELYHEMQRAQDLISDKQRRPVSLEEVMSHVFKDYNKRNDPLEKAKRDEQRQIKKQMKKQTKEEMKNESKVSQQEAKSCSPSANDLHVLRHVKGKYSSRRTSIPAKTKHQVMRRDQGKCSYRDTKGRRCSARRWLDLHHRVRVNEGGDNRPDNLMLLCRGHHQMLHVQQEMMGL